MLNRVMRCTKHHRKELKSGNKNPGPSVLSRRSFFIWACPSAAQGPRPGRYVRCNLFAEAKRISAAIAHAGLRLFSGTVRNGEIEFYFTNNSGSMDLHLKRYPSLRLRQQKWAASFLFALSPARGQSTDQHSSYSKLQIYNPDHR